MSYSSLIVRSGEDLKFMNLIPNTLFTGDDTPIELPVNEGEYCLNVSSTGSRIFTPLKPSPERRRAITITQFGKDSSSPSSVTANSQFTYNNIPDGSYLMMISAQIYTSKYRFTIPKYALSANGNNDFYATYIRGFTANIETQTIVDVDKDGVLRINASTSGCDDYAYCYFNISLIPVN